MNNKYKIVLLGSGNVASHLAEMLKINNINIYQIFNVNKKSGENLAQKYNSTFISDLNDIDKNADLYIVSVKDNNIVDIITKLVINKGIIVHTSGTTSIDIFSSNFKNYGILYPLQTFTKNVDLNYSEIPFLIEANNLQSLNTIEYIAKKISKNIIKADSNQRKALHIAAVFACNFTNYLYSISDELLTKQGLSFDILKPLIEETTRKALIEKPINNQTGPAKRKDLKVINEHLNALEGEKEYQKLYGLISEMIIRQK